MAMEITLCGTQRRSVLRPNFSRFSKLSGVARDMAKTGWPYALAPMLHPNGTMLDATPLAGAIVRIDVEIVPTPQHYMIGRLYPTHAQTALQALCTTRLDFVKSVRGLRRTPHPSRPKSSTN